MDPISRLEKVEFQLTSACNMYCVFCFNNDRIKTEVLAPNQITSTIKETVESTDPHSNLKEVWMTGGEPLLEINCVKEVTKVCKELNLHSGIATNGILLPQYARELCKIGLNEVRISLDSTNPQLLSEIRGFKGALPKVVNGIKAAVESGLITSIRITVNKKNVNESEEIAKFADSLGVDRIELKGILPIGRAKAVMMAENQKLESSFSKALKSTSKNIIILCNCLPECEGFKVQQNISCVCARTATYVACNGAIVPCSYFPHKSDYNIKKNSLLEAWKTPLFEKVRTCRPTHCNSCTHWNNCKNGCPAMLYQYGKLDSKCFDVINQLQKEDLHGTSNPVS